MKRTVAEPGAEAVFDALLKTYPSGDVVLLQYYEVVRTKNGQIAVTNSLSSPDGDARWEFASLNQMWLPNGSLT